MWYKIENNQVCLQIYAKPLAKRTTLLKIENDKLHIALHAKPHEGEANKELILYLAKFFELPKKSVLLRRGQASKYKEILIPLTEKVQKFLNEKIFDKKA